jgi:hypothetical protein
MCDLNFLSSLRLSLAKEATLVKVIALVGWKIEPRVKFTPIDYRLVFGI